MMSRNSILLIVVSAVALVIVLLTFRQSDSDAYLVEIEKERTEKDRYFSTSDESPFQGTTFTGLNFFPPNPAYRVQAELSLIQDRRLVTLATNDGQQKSYQEYAWVEFALDQRMFRLLVLEVIDSGPNRGALFLAFADETSAGETYGAGRYLDIKKVPGASAIELDFNKAYNPYCAYGDHFSCPLPPRENILGASIRAGEKTYP